MTRRATIIFELPPDRNHVGTARVEDDRGVAVAGPFPAYGRADQGEANRHGNPTRSPLRLFGDTPTGTYRVPRAVATGTGTRYNNHSYGPNGALVLDPINGDAEIAQQNGRTGLLIHGGGPGHNGALRATHGCLRLSNENMGAVLDALDQLSLDHEHFRCEVVDVHVVVDEPAEPESGEDSEDPPPDIGDLIRNAPDRWVPRNLAPRLKARLIPPENRDRMVTSAREEARRRSLLENWEQSLSGVSPAKLALADYWWGVFQQKAADIANEARRDEIKALAQRIEALQDTASALYAKYQDALRAMVDAQKFTAVLDTIGAIVGAIRSGISEFGSKDGDGAKKATDKGKPETGNEPRIQWSINRASRFGESVEMLKIEVNGKINNLEELNRLMYRHYREQQVELYPPQPVPLKRLP